ncbi:MAG TPA: YihY/virulence factor BrkB family protein [Steroidobacteraceae bacterium]|jgi:membrane protein
MAIAPAHLGRFPVRKIYLVVRDSVFAWMDHNASSLGAALAYYTLFSIAPILVIAVAIAGYVFGSQYAETHLLAQIQDLLGNAGATAVQGLLESAEHSQKKGIAAALGIVTLLIGATSVFGELQNTLDLIWQTARKKPAVPWWRILRARLLSFGLIMGVGFLLMVSLIVSAALAALGEWLNSFMGESSVILPAMDVIISLSMTTLLFALIYKYVPKERVGWQDVWIGGFVTACLFTIGKALIGLYIGRSSLSSAYGAAGSIMVLLVWIYYSAQIFLLGAEFTHVFAYSHGSRRNLKS